MNGLKFELESKNSPFRCTHFIFKKNTFKIKDSIQTYVPNIFNFKKESINCDLKKSENAEYRI